MFAIYKVFAVVGTSRTYTNLMLVVTDNFFNPVFNTVKVVIYFDKSIDLSK